MSTEDSNDEITCPAGHSGQWLYIEKAIVGVYEVEVIGNKIRIDATDGTTCFVDGETEREGFLECGVDVHGRPCGGLVYVSDDRFEIDREAVKG